MSIVVSKWSVVMGLMLVAIVPVTHQSVNGGTNCATCSVIVALVEQYSEFHNTSIVTTLEKLCSFLPTEIKPLCNLAVKTLGPALIQLIVDGADPDVACHALKFCHTDPGQPTCHSMLPPSAASLNEWQFQQRVDAARQSIIPLLQKQSNFKLGVDICDVPGIKEICDWIKKTVANQIPAVDLDKDGFSTYYSLRGTAWRGKDCSDDFNYVYPGVIPKDGDDIMDSNCNGIYGVNLTSKKTYEDELCANYQPRGVAVLGDSVGAHFHLPPQWFDATIISEKAFTNAVMIIENEIDWPMMSTTTGYGTNEWPDVITGPVDSVYLRLRQRNRCNHRDYQNIAANGERSSSVNNIVKTLSRNAQNDRPMVVFYALVGNDVCNGHPDTFDHMTTPAEMYNNTMLTLDYLAKVLPNNSHVVLIGLADGRVLFDNMGPRIHPTSTYWGTFTYGKFYDYMNCLQISPCMGWMNTNQTMRDLTTKRAQELSAVLSSISQTQKGRYSNFDLYYLDNPINQAIKKWVAQGGQAWQLIEPVDGFHDNQMGQAFVAGVIWDDLMAMSPDIFGPVNPNNDQIGNLFGDQGGY
ncbi:acyloxyacyl hydrolase-like isoform X1 [Biomphalaria glabrata]|uniref:Acyloxyacyl hydrolase-like isoform X1 n=1 Tax=Biomphalaria glabrata TaxID=6526 RepID=A0A9W3AW77_BIOGL|nr:acyloxyacyl hydrolase-like isoform X1 [Biomphalaria glabrata]